jgi:uncharacterized protein (TIGR03437 family)
MNNAYTPSNNNSTVPITYPMKHLLYYLILSLPLLAQPGGGGGVRGDGIWRRDAVFGEILSLDNCFGHQPPSGEYHYHANPVCLRASLDDNIELVRTNRTGSTYREKTTGLKHSPILGWSYDGYPVYGPYAYADANNPNSGIRRIRSGFRLRTMTTRNSLPAWSLSVHPGVSETLATNQYGPPVSAEFPLGRYIEDWEHVGAIGDLDQYNGRTGVTPEFPNGTYAYFITINEDGSSAFPYMAGSEYYGTVNLSRTVTVPDGVATYMGAGQTAPVITSWSTSKARQEALVISGFNPSAGPRTTWPVDTPAGVTVSGATSTPIAVDIQQIRFSDSMVYINGTGLANHVMGPWFDPLQRGGNFGSFPSNQNYTRTFPRTPAVATTKTAGTLGALGVWVNGTAMYNYLDGTSYNTAAGAEAGSPAVITPTFVNVSAASYERGPLTPGGLVTATAVYGAVLSTSTEAASTAVWPTSLGGATVTVRDAAGTSRAAEVVYASPTQVNYRIPADTSTGYATVAIAAGGNTINSNISIIPVYPNIFIANAEEVAAGQAIRTAGEAIVTTSTLNPVDLGATGDVYLVLYGSGRGNTTMATATIGGVASTVAFAGAQGQYAGLDQYNLIVPRSLAGRGRVPVVLTLDGKTSNPVYIDIR